MKPKGDIYYGYSARFYLNKRLKQEKWHAEQDIVKKILSTYPDNISILDVPFGTGRFVPFYLEKNMDVYGIDISQDMIDVAKETLGDDFNKIKIQIGDSTRLPYKDNFFDITVSFRFLSDIVSFKKAKKTLAEISRVTRSIALLQVSIRGINLEDVGVPKDNERIGDSFIAEDFHCLMKDYGLRIDDIVFIYREQPTIRKNKTEEHGEEYSDSVVLICKKI